MIAEPPTIPSIELSGLLAEGGHGTLYRGVDLANRQRVAVKITECGSSSRRRSDLLREGKCLQRMEHPNIVAVYRYGALENHVYMVMEYIRGMTLERFLRKHPDELRGLARDVIAQMSSALEYLHGLSPPVIHRDLSPANILIDMHNQRAVLIDFGAAVSTTSRVPFTPGFACPDRMMDMPPAAAMDLYSLGALIEWMRTELSLPAPSFARWSAALRQEQAQKRPDAMAIRRMVTAGSDAWNGWWVLAAMMLGMFVLVTLAAGAWLIWWLF
jgi:serine/threonine protein kinase